MRTLLTLALLAWTTTAAALPLETIKLPPGIAIELWARVDNPRQMALGGVDAQGGVLYVGSRGAGFDWNPADGALGFTDNGRDMLGNDSPPDELNRVARGASVQSSSRRHKSSAPTSPVSACASTTARCFPPNTAGRFSSPNTVRGTARGRSATASVWCGCRTAAP
ncbi:MAG: hypothetical protein U1A72_04645 [Sulfuritalea sp.]|nr:hypothetical protein [Sulfuritalea sp.]